ncbi:hypothetical protein P67b_00070 [Ruegeria phage Tedan]|nr:hypothetical protein P67b_00070 [Ruegeria phage Tedan]
MKQTTGRQRAQARLKAKLKANEKIPSGERETRQQRRAAARRADKAQLQALRREIGKKRAGGSAAVTAEELLDV